MKNIIKISSILLVAFLWYLAVDFDKMSPVKEMAFWFCEFIWVFGALGATFGSGDKPDPGWPA